jgi:hypothetical protein
MSDQPGTFEVAILEISRAVGGISSRLGDDGVLDTFAELGVQFPPELLQNAAVTSARSAIATAGARLSSQVSDLETAISGGAADQIVSAALALSTTIAQLITSFGQLPGALQAAVPSLPGITAAQVNDLVADLPERLLDLLLHEALTAVPVVGAVLEAFGVVERTFHPGDAANPTKPDFDSISLHLDRLLPTFTNPVAQLQSVYHWGDPAFDAALLLTVLDGALAHLGLPVLLRPASGGNPVTLEAFAVDLTPTTSGSPPGLDVDLVLPASIDRTFTFPVSPPTWMATVIAHAAVAARAHGTVRPPFDIEISASETVTASASATLSAQPASPMILIGETGGSRLELAGVTLGGGAELAWDSSSGKATGGPTLQGAITGGKLVIDASSGDGFIAQLLSGVHVEAGFGLQFAFAPDTGVRFEGSGSLEIQIPVHLSLGPLGVESVYLVVSFVNGTIPVELSAGLSAELGPLSASVDRLGAVVTASFPSGGGNLGPAQLDVAFKPPTGAGLSLDLAIITGGGFLSIDTARGQYVGILQFEIAGFIGVSAIGLIDTKNPDGTPGFSLLIILTADFGPGIQLGFGFTLNAVGGILGLNRTMVFDAIMQGVRSDAIESVMFPHDIVANAPRIVSDLRAFFPPHDGTFLFGPMAKLGWGEPTLVSLSLGVIMVIPPADIAILGVLKLALPAEDLGVLVLQVNFAGALEFSKQRLYFFASLYDSHLLFITIQGEMGLLFAYGDDANFVVSVGGFHPQFNPPPLPFPTPQRIQVDVINESYARIRCDGYFAVTTNTVQFGSHSDMFFGFSALSVEGHSGFDALIQFSPFHFTVEISTSFSVKVFGVGVWGLGIDLTLEGPTPWHAHGTASISFFFFSVDVSIDFTWGDARDTTLPPVAVMPIVAGELGKRSNWKAQLPNGSNLLVSLRQLSADEAALVLHPAGTLQVSQRAVPLDLKLDKLGSQKPSDANQFSLDVSSAGLSKTRNLQEPFAPSQFRDADDATKLSQPAYSPADSGIELAPAGRASDGGIAVTRIVRYDLHIVDTKLVPAPVFHRFFAYPGALFQHWLGGASVTFNDFSAQRAKLTKPYADAVSVSGETYAVANLADNTVVHSEAAAFSSPAAAQDYLANAVDANPALAGSLHIVPAFEVAA